MEVVLEGGGDGVPPAVSVSLLSQATNYTKVHRFRCRVSSAANYNNRGRGTG